MDIATIIGLVLGAVVIAGAILMGGAPQMFIDGPSVLVVIFGAIAAMFASFPLGNILALPKVMMKTIFAKPVSMDAILSQLVSFAEIARRDGILALENHVDEIEDPLLILGIQMAVDGTDPELIEAIMEADLENMISRHEVSKSIFDCLGKYAPAFGMIGTLIGLVTMLGDMSDPSGIGAGMAVALLTTLYGAIMANVIFCPLADKLALRSNEEIVAKTIVIKGVISIQSGDNPRVVEQKLKTFLPPSAREGGKDDLAQAA